MPKYDYFRKEKGGEYPFVHVGQREFRNIKEAATFAKRHGLIFERSEVIDKELKRRVAERPSPPVERVIRATKQESPFALFEVVPPVVPSAPVTAPCSCRDQILMYGAIAFVAGWIILPWIRDRYFLPSA